VLVAGLALLALPAALSMPGNVIAGTAWLVPFVGVGSIVAFVVGAAVGLLLAVVDSVALEVSGHVAGTRGM
jgi:hypothetical protein